MISAATSRTSVAVVEPAHAAQHAVGRRLHRHVEVRAQHAAARHQIEQPRRHLGRIDRAQPDARQRRGLGDHLTRSASVSRRGAGPCRSRRDGCR